MRILFLTAEHPDVPGTRGGIGSFVASASVALAGAGHEVHVLVCAPGLPAADRRVAGVQLHTRGLLPALRPARGRFPCQVALAASCRWHARSLGAFDVVEAPEWQALAAGFALHRSAPLVVSLQTPSAVVSAHDLRIDPPTRAYDWLERWTVRRADAVLSLSRLLVDELRSTGWLRPSTSVDVAPVVLDTDAWATVPPADSTEPVVLGVGRMEPRKGFELLVEAAALVTDVPGLRVELVGGDTSVGPGGSVGSRLVEQAARLGVDLRLRGEVPRAELADVIAGARLVVIPSTFDSFNMAGLEALAAGRPVVVTDRMGLAELTDDTEAITIVSPRRADRLAAAISALAGDPERAARAGRHGRALVQRHSAAAFAADRAQRYERAGAARSDLR